MIRWIREIRTKAELGPRIAPIWTSCSVPGQCIIRPISYPRRSQQRNRVRAVRFTLPPLAIHPCVSDRCRHSASINGSGYPSRTAETCRVVRLSRTAYTSLRCRRVGVMPPVIAALTDAVTRYPRWRRERLPHPPRHAPRRPSRQIQSQGAVPRDARACDSSAALPNSISH